MRRALTASLVAEAGPHYEPLASPAGRAACLLEAARSGVEFVVEAEERHVAPLHYQVPLVAPVADDRAGEDGLPAVEDGGASGSSRAWNSASVTSPRSIMRLRRRRSGALSGGAGSGTRRPSGSGVASHIFPTRISWHTEPLSFSAKGPWPAVSS